MSKDEVTPFPISNFNVKALPEYEMIYIQLAYMTNALQKIDEPNLSPHFSLSPKAARELLKVLSEQLNILEKSDKSNPDAVKH